jgi:hypothetical protein
MRPVHNSPSFHLRTGMTGMTACSTPVRGRRGWEALAAYVLLLWMAFPAQAALFQAHAHTPSTARLVQRDLQEDSYWTGDGGYDLFAKAFARTLELTDRDSSRWPAAGQALKSTLPRALGSIDEDHSHQGASGVVAADAVADAAEGYGFATASWKPGRIWGTFAYKAYAYAVPAGGVDSNAYANGYVEDPTQVYYNTGGFDLIMQITFHAGTSLSAGANGAASSRQYATLDLNADGVVDQPWWSFSFGADGTGRTHGLSLSLGPNVYLDGGQTPAEVESILNAGWVSDTDYLLSQDVTLSFVYPVPGTRAAGSLIFGLGCEDDAAAASVPEPASLALLLGGALAAVRRRRVQF